MSKNNCLHLVTKFCSVLSFTLKVWKLMDVLSVSLSQNEGSGFYSHRFQNKYYLFPKLIKNKTKTQTKLNSTINFSLQN